MKRKRFTEEQIMGVLKEAAAGATTLDLCRRHGLSEQTFYRLEGENGRLKRLVGLRRSTCRSTSRRGPPPGPYERLHPPAAPPRRLGPPPAPAVCGVWGGLGPPGR